ncbi:MAG: hypothetical protein IKU35_08275 [Bacteroidaceae bacterium]|nr:hypothetical protein [Bacteroidaceae bacterium]
MARQILILLLLLLPLFSCGSDDAYPYTQIENDDYATRVYTLQNGVKLYLTQNGVAPRVALSLCFPSMTAAGLDTLYTPSRRSAEYPLLAARIGSNGAVVHEQGSSLLISDDIPASELENWSIIMRGTFRKFPVGLSVVVSGDIDFAEAVTLLRRHFADVPMFEPSAVALSSADDARWLLNAVPVADSFVRKIEAGTIAAADVDAIKNNYALLCESEFYDNAFRARAISYVALRSCAGGDAGFLAHRLDSVTAASFRALKPMKLGRRPLAPDSIDATASNSIKLLAPPPTKVLFPDADNLEVHFAPYRPHFIVGDESRDVYRLALLVPASVVPASIMSAIARYVNSRFESLATDFVAEVAGTSLALCLKGRGNDAAVAIPHAVARLKELLRARPLYDYLLSQGETLAADKRTLANIAPMSVAYAKGGNRVCGLRAIADSFAEQLFSPTTEILYSGDNADKVRESLMPLFGTTPVAAAGSYAEPGDTAAACYILPLATDGVTAINISDDTPDAADAAAMLVHNVAVQLSRAPQTGFYSNGALVAPHSASEQLPFSRELFSAAQSMLLYGLSSIGSDAPGLFREYQHRRFAGHSSAVLYDALIGLDYSDVEELYDRCSRRATTRFVIGKGSSAAMQMLMRQGGAVLLTLDEVFGY